MRYTRLTAPHDSPYAQGSVHAYLLHGEVPTLVDAPSGTDTFIDEVQEALRAAGDDTLAQVIVTHAHPDHIDGAVAVHARWPQAVFRKRAPLPDGDGIPWRLIEKEPMDGVLSDDQLVAVLKGSGVDIARRTVAKYRESLNIPSSIQRRRMAQSEAR